MKKERLSDLQKVSQLIKKGDLGVQVRPDSGSSAVSTSLTVPPSTLFLGHVNRLLRTAFGTKFAMFLNLLSCV